MLYACFNVCTYHVYFTINLLTYLSLLCVGSKAVRMGLAAFPGWMSPDITLKKCLFLLQYFVLVLFCLFCCVMC